jgi:glycosyltransferase involved in cell wall biosynthesis/SAM-dependent methyltransferase
LTDTEDSSRRLSSGRKSRVPRSQTADGRPVQITTARPSRETTLERTTCPECGEQGVSTGFQAETLSGRRQQFLRCLNCRLLFDPNPEVFHYEEGFYVDNPYLDPKLYLEKGASIRLFAHLVLQGERTSNLSRRGRRPGPGKGKLWEVGSGPGLLLDLASFDGWKILGMEPAPEAVKWGKDVLGIESIAESLHRVPPLADADVVIAAEVIEHLESPLEFASALYDSLNQDGVALLTTPNAESKVLTERGGTWVHLGLGYHLVLYSASAIERLLRNAGFMTIEVGAFEGPYQDERLIILASKKWIPGSNMREVLRNTLESDKEALDLSTRYLWDVVRRFDGEKNTYWQGALYRLVEYLIAASQYEKAIEVANRLEDFMRSQGWTKKYVLDTLEEALRTADRRLLYSKVPTFMGNFHFLRGLAMLRSRQEQRALEEFRFAFGFTEKMEKLPYKAYEELRDMPLSLHALFHIGFALLQMGRCGEATSVFNDFLGFGDRLQAESSAHARLNLSMALEGQGRFEEATGLLKDLVAAAKEKKLPEALIAQASQRILQIHLDQRTRELEASRQELQRLSQQITEDLDKTRLQLEGRTQELETANQQLQAAQQRLEWQSEEIDKTRLQLEGRTQELETANQQLQAAQQRLEWQSEDLDQIRQQLEGRTQGLETANQQLQAAQQRLEWQSEELDQTRLQLEGRTQGLETANQQLQAAQQRLERQSEELDKTRLQLEGRTQELENAHQQFQSESQQLQERNQKLLGMQQQVDYQSRELVSVRSELAREQAIHQALETELRSLRHRIVNKANTIIKMKTPSFHKMAKGMVGGAVRRIKEFRDKRRTALETKRKKAQPDGQQRPAKVRPPVIAAKFEKVRIPEVPRQSGEYVGCTIICKNDLPKARVLAPSWKEHNPGAPFFVLVTDLVDGYFDHTNEDFYTVEAASLPIPNQGSFFFKYSLLEASTGVKPYFLEYLFTKHDFKKLVYLDSDILVTDNFGPLIKVLDEHSIVVTPHLTSPVSDDKHPSETTILQSGTFNLGFIALRKSETSMRMLKWWQERLYSQCIMAPERGMHVDQKWIDLVPGCFGDTYVLREPGYNIAYWNLHDRQVKVENGRISVNGQPAYFFHFSGIEPENLGMVSKHQNRWRLKQCGDLNVLFERYAKLVLAAGWKECRSWPYSYDFFDNGARIPALARRLYWDLGTSAADFGDPLATQSMNSFLDWLNQPIDGDSANPIRVSRLWHALYQCRADLRRAYPDLLGAHRAGFLEWMRNSAPVECDFDPCFYPDEHPAIVSRTAPKPEKFGVNVLGYVHSEKGMGEAVRSDIRILSAADIPHVVMDFADEHGSQNIERTVTNLSESSPHIINLFHVNADQVDLLVKQKGAQFRDRYNIGFWTWEQSQFPPDWDSAFRHFDEIWVPSNFVRDAVAKRSPIPVMTVPHSINPEIPVAQGFTLGKLGVPPGTFVFLFFFDFYSQMERKNPMGLVRAFLRAFGDQRDALLLIKCSHSIFAPAPFNQLEEACRGGNVRLFESVLPREECNALIAACDCYVSLHRAEGFGLTLAEAMCFGRPVIATGYSGNVDFMHEKNSFPVKYHLTELEMDHGPYKKGSAWAEPDIDHAAGLMRYVYEHRKESKIIGEEGRREAFQQLHPKTVGRFVREHLIKVTSSGEALPQSSFVSQPKF